MDVLYRLIGSVVALVFIAAAFLWLFNPRRGFELLKKLGAVLVGVILGVNLLRHVGPALAESADPSWLLIFLVISPVAYLIREAHLRIKRRIPQHGKAVERTPVMPNHNMEDDA